MSKVSQQKLLNTLFEIVYGRGFQSQDREDRILLQKAIFLMREVGISCGKYFFVWDHYGPFSPELSDDMKLPVDPDEQDMSFNDATEKVMQQLSELFSSPFEYSQLHWVETIASLKYMKDYMYPTYDDEQLIAELEARKGYLSRHDENQKAMAALNAFMAEYTIC